MRRIDVMREQALKRWDDLNVFSNSNEADITPREAFAEGFDAAFRGICSDQKMPMHIRRYMLDSLKEEEEE